MTLTTLLLLPPNVNINTLPLTGSNLSIVVVIQTPPITIHIILGAALLNPGGMGILVGTLQQHVHSTQRRAATASVVVVVGSLGGVKAAVLLH